MLYNLDDPKKVGPGMAVAIITTLYGVISAYLFFLPMAGKLKVRDDEERLVKEVAIEGILALHAGEAPVAGTTLCGQGHVRSRLALRPDQ